MGAAKRRIEGLIAAGLLAVVACGTGPGAHRPSVNVSGFAFRTLDGGRISLAQLHGKIVVMHLFTTWSVASLVDVTRLQALAARKPAGVVVLGVALDPDGPDLVGPWQRAMHVSYPIALATAALRNGKSILGRIRRVPTTLIVDRYGHVRRRIERQLKPQELPRLVEAARRPR